MWILVHSKGLRFNNVNDWEKDEDHEEAEAYTAATTTTMKGGKEGDKKTEANFNEVKTELKEIESKIDGLSELLLDIINPISEPYNATMGNDMTMNFKSKLGKFETPGKDNKKEASMDDA
ncbi:hypothetical protein AAG906_026087 [Vitis piasezkii]